MPRLLRTPETWLIYAQLGLWGYFLYGIGPVVPLLRDEQGVSAAVASLHGTALAVGGLIAGGTFPILVRRLGRGHTMWLSLTGAALSTIVLCLFGALPATLAATAVASVFGTMVVSGVVAGLSEQHGPAGPAAISEANAAAAGMGIVSPLVIGLAVGAGLGWRPGLAAMAGLVVVLAVVALALGVRVPRGRSFAGVSARTAVRPPALPRAYWIAWTLMGVTGSVEVCLSLWAAAVLRDHAGLSPGAAAAGVASIVSGMFLGRLAGGRFALRLAPVPLLLAALGVSAVGFAVFWLATAGWLAIAGLVVVGLGNAMHYPLAISLAMAASGGQNDRAAGYASYSIAVGFGVAPVVLGWVADGVGAHLAFLLLPGLLAAAALLAVRLGRAISAAPAAPAPASMPAADLALVVPPIAGG
ncbi:MAG TPA: MFS transporter [Micromonosporaceae bacterium]|nr:MFS transporter [Micromonosporaceae bacterium]